MRNIVQLFFRAEGINPWTVLVCLIAASVVEGLGFASLVPLLWIIADPDERLDAIGRWTVLPDFASVNFDEDGAAELAAALLRRGVDIEAGVANRFAAEQLVRSGLADRCLRIMFEPREQLPAAALASVSEAEAVLDAAAVRCPRLLHGVDATAWTLLDEAAARRYDGRIGLEDTLTLPDGRPADGNGELVRTARQRVSSTLSSP